jgi:hypothetical protein
VGSGSKSRRQYIAYVYWFLTMKQKAGNFSPWDR